MSKLEIAVTDDKTRFSTDLNREETRDNIEGVSYPEQQLHRQLSSRQVQLVAIGGSIGTALFVSIGYALFGGGSGSLFLAFTVYSCVLAVVNNAMAEMAVFMPVSAAFVRHASRWVDDAWGFMAGWNFYLYEAIAVPFEITALNLVLTFWRDDIPVGAICAGCIVAYGLLNIVAVKWFGESEFWLSGGKVLLIVIVFLFTFFTMVGANPQHHAYGFTNWNSPTPFLEFHSAGDLGRFEGFLVALWQASFTIVGPEYLATVAGEVKLPRRNLKRAFKTAYARFGIFFIGGALCVSIICPANDPVLVAILTGTSGGSGTGAASPYIIAMHNMGVTVLPHIVNALLCTAIFSAGNAYFYCATRALHSLAQDGHAPKIFRKCTKSGVPIYSFAVTLIFPLISLLQLSNSTAQVITWLISLITAGGMINYIVMCVNYLCFYRALKAQGIDRTSLPYRGYLQPYITWFALCFLVCVVTCYGYSVFLPSHFTVGKFFSYYTMIFSSIVTFVGWKIVKRTRFLSPTEADLVWERPEIDRYEELNWEEDVPFTKACLQWVRRKTTKSRSGDSE